MKAGSGTAMTTTYAFVEGEHGTNSTTGLVKSISQAGGNFTYTYDDNGNIVNVVQDGKKTAYTYDALGQLTQVDDQQENATWVYKYDQGGNILSKKKYAFGVTTGEPTESKTFTYGNAKWKDQLTAVDGVAITYDAIGNPLNDGTWTYTWQNGRQLASMSKSGTTASFKYNENGLRVQKTVNGVVTDYILHGKNIVHMKQGSNNLHFFYDAQNKPAVVVFNGTAYAYLYNLQGDVIGLLDSNGNKIVSYIYDAWGKPLSKTGSLSSTLGTIQPFRYRGYVFDEETGLYYLRSRYYHPNAARFANADEIIGGRRMLLTHNLYSYCLNTAPNAIDRSGHSLQSFVDSVAKMAALVVEAMKRVVSSVGAELQLIANRTKAKKALADIGDKQNEYLLYPYGGAENAVFEGLFGKYIWFYNQVTHNAPMDYKREARRPWWALGKDKFYFRGKIISFEEYGNINYGYVGKALGIADWVLYAGGGFAAVTGGGDIGGINTYFDSQADHDNVAWGIAIYNDDWGDE